MKIIDNTISKQELVELAEESFSDFVKAVVDIEKQIMVIDAELHSDEESLLLQEGSKQINLWGINIYPTKNSDEWIEFDSVINIRPRLKNFSRFVEDESIQKEIIAIVNNLVK